MDVWFDPLFATLCLAVGIWLLNRKPKDIPNTAAKNLIATGAFSKHHYPQKR